MRLPAAASASIRAHLTEQFDPTWEAVVLIPSSHGAIGDFSPRPTVRSWTQQRGVWPEANLVTGLVAHGQALAAGLGLPTSAHLCLVAVRQDQAWRLWAFAAQFGRLDSGSALVALTAERDGPWYDFPLANTRYWELTEAGAIEGGLHHNQPEEGFDVVFHLPDLPKPMVPMITHHLLEHLELPEPTPAQVRRLGRPRATPQPVLTLGKVFRPH
jgi:hypothetical protein